MTINMIEIVCADNKELYNLIAIGGEETWTIL